MSIIIVGVGPAEFEGESGLGNSREGGWKHRPFLRDAFGVPEEGTVFPSPVATPPRLGDTGCHPPAMEELDGDEVRVSSRGRYAERDIVQVTPALSPVPPRARDAQPLADPPAAAGLFPTGLQTSFPQKFVPFRDYVDDSGNQVLSMARLAKDVLAEIPEQLLSYMKTRDIKPRRADPQ